MQKKLTELKGVGEKTAALFAKKGICTVDDLLHMYPYDYDYFSIPVTVDDAQRMSQGQTGTVKIEPVSIKLHLIGNGTMSFGGGYRITSFRAADLTGQIRLVWFNMPYLTRALHAGEIRVFRGYLKKYKNGNLSPKTKVLR